MNRLTTVLLWALAPSTALARCQWSHLQDATDAYLESQTSGKPYDIFLSDKVVYRENNRVMSPKAGIITKPLEIAHQHRLYDQDDCATYTEQIITDPKNPYVIGTQLRFNESDVGVTVTSIDSIVTTTGDWLFNASQTLAHVLAEDWNTIPSDRGAPLATPRRNRSRRHDGAGAACAADSGTLIPAARTAAPTPPSPSRRRRLRSGRTDDGSGMTNLSERNRWPEPTETG